MFDKFPWRIVVAFTPDGRNLAISNLFNEGVMLLNLTGLNRLRDHAVERACSIAHGGLNRDEWARYLLDLPYQDTCPA